MREVMQSQRAVTDLLPSCPSHASAALPLMQNELITSIVDLLLEKCKQFEGRAADYQQNISDIFPVLQKLNTGVDVNVKFHDIHAFEVCPGCMVDRSS
jgi:hypothetical protein